MAGLCPVTLAEARLAARHVAAEEHAGECLRQVSQPRHNPDQQNKCRAQSNSMARPSERAPRTLYQPPAPWTHGRRRSPVMLTCVGMTIYHAPMCQWLGPLVSSSHFAILFRIPVMVGSSPTMTMKR